MAEVVAWQRTASSEPVIHRAAQALANGRLVAFPTETVYGIAASALNPDAVNRLAYCKDRPEDKPLTLAIGSAAEALDWVPRLSPLGRRLARRSWPGPMTLVCGDGVAEGLAGRLPEATQRRVCPEGTIGLRVPAHEAISQVRRLLPGPLVLTSANRSGEPDAVTPEAVLETVGTRIDMLIADGPSHFGKASTVVHVQGNSWTILREGVMSVSSLERLAGCLIVFVCTGNTCRSPLAEGLCKKMLAERLGCAPEELPARGFQVRSAGLAAMMGGPAADEAIRAAGEHGVDLSLHVSRPLTPELAAQADLLIAMTQSHLLALQGHYQATGIQPRLLRPDGADVPDPIGADQETYRVCAQQIRDYVEDLLPEVLGEAAKGGEAR
jgi:protein-tyrosine phosphatase